MTEYIGHESYIFNASDEFVTEMKWHRSKYELQWSRCTLRLEVWNRFCVSRWIYGRVVYSSLDQLLIQTAKYVTLKCELQWTLFYIHLIGVPYSDGVSVSSIYSTIFVLKCHSSSFKLLTLYPPYLLSSHIFSSILFTCRRACCFTNYFVLPHSIVAVLIVHKTRYVALLSMTVSYCNIYVNLMISWIHIRWLTWNDWFGITKSVAFYSRFSSDIRHKNR